MIRLIIAWGPLLLVGLWGLSYLRAVLITTLAPGLPFSLILHTKGGSLKLKGSSFSLSFSRGLFLFNDLSLLDPQGHVMASAKELQVKGPGLLHLKSGPFHIRVTNGFALLNRTKNGQFSFEAYLPEPQQTPSEIATDFYANSIRFVYVDTTGLKPYQQSGVISNVHFASFYGSYLGTGNTIINGLGQARISFATQEHQPVQVGIQNASLSIASLPPPLTEVINKANPRLLSELGFARATIRGDAQLGINSAGKVSVLSQFTLQATSARWNTFHAPNLSFAGRLSLGYKNQLWGDLSANSNVSRVQTSLTVDWTGPVQASGNFVTNSADLNQLLADASQTPIKALSVQQIAAHGSFDFSRTSGFRLSTTSLAKQATFEGKSVNQARLSATLADQKVRFKAEGTSPEIGDLSASGTYKITDQHLSLLIDTLHSRLDKLIGLLPKSARTKVQMSGPVNAQVNITGPISNLQANFRAQATGDVRSSHLTSPIQIQGFALVGGYAKGLATINRMWMKTDSGTAWGEGTLDIHSMALRASIDGRAFPLNLIQPDLAGLASASGNLSGTLKSPHFNGIAEVYDGGYQGTTLTLAHGTVTADLHQLRVSNLEALRQASLITGSLGLNLDSQDLSGQLSGAHMHIGDFFGNQFLGNFNAEITQIGGTLSNPTAMITASGENLIANTVPISNAELHASFAKRTLTLNSSKIDLNPGSVSGTGQFNLDSHKGSADLVASRLDFGRLIAEAFPAQDYHFDGNADGQVNLTFNQKGIESADATGTVDSVAINKAPVGDGPWNLNYGHDSLTGNLQISHKTTFLSLENVQITHLSSAQNESVSGAFLANNISLADLQNAIQPVVSKLPATVQRNLFGVDGQVQTEIDFSGPFNNLADLTVTVPELTANDLKRSETSFGSIHAAGGMKNGVITVSNGTYSDGSATGSFEMSLDPGNSIDADVELDGFDLSKLLTFFPQSLALNGTANVSLIAKGKPDDPDIRASALARNISYGSKTTVFGVNLDDIQAHQGLITATGDLTYNGFVGKLAAKLPYLSTPSASTANLEASLILDQRPLSDFQPYIPELASRLGDGTFNGFVKLQGGGPENPFRNLHLTGQMLVEGKGLALQVPRALFEPNAKQFLPLNTGLGQYNLGLFLDDAQIRTTLDAQSSEGGKISGVASSTIEGLNGALADFANLKKINVLESPLDGKLTISSFSVKENSSDLSTSGRLSGALSLSGTLKNPRISGDLLASNLTTSIPSLNSGPSAESTPSIDPTFDISLGINGVATIKTALASIGMKGTGKLGGSLSNPSFHADLSVASGRFRLPGGEVRLQPGGTVTGSYADNGFGTSTAQLLVDIFGNTHVTAAPSPDQIQRYDVSLEIRGDLLDPNNVQILASSDPPDLTQTEILNLLGRTDILSALNGGTGSKSGAIQNVLTGYALPSLLEPLTSNLSKSLGLDYLSLDYDSFGQTSLLLGKRLGGGFSISIQRQISAPLPGYPLYYDYRLNYHPAFLGQKFRSFNFLLGTDQQNLWKVGFQYSTRF